MKLSPLALPLSIVALAFSLQSQEPATLVHLDGTVQTQAVRASEVISIGSDAVGASSGGIFASPYIVPAGKTLLLDRVQHAGDSNTNTIVTIRRDGIEIIRRNLDVYALSHHDLGGMPIPEGSIMTLSVFAGATRAMLIGTLLDN